MFFPLRSQSNFYIWKQIYIKSHIWRPFLREIFIGWIYLWTLFSSLRKKTFSNQNICTRKWFHCSQLVILLTAPSSFLEGEGKKLKRLFLYFTTCVYLMYRQLQRPWKQQANQQKRTSDIKKKKKLRAMEIFFLSF